MKRRLEEPALIIAAVKPREPLLSEANNGATFILLDLDFPKAHVRGDLLFAHEECLILSAPGLYAMHLARISVFGLVVVADDQNVWLLSALIRFHDLLCGV